MRFVEAAGEAVRTALLLSIEGQRSAYEELGMKDEFERLKGEVNTFADRMKEQVVGSLTAAGEGGDGWPSPHPEAAEAFRRFWEDASRMLVQGGPGMKRLQDLQAHWVEGYGSVLKEFFMSDMFGRTLGATLNGLLDARKRVRDMNEETLTMLGLPTKSEVDALAKKVTELQREVHRLGRRDRSTRKKKGGRR